MVKNTLKVITNTLGICTALMIPFVGLNNTHADDKTNFNVNVKEALSVSVTTPSSWASGNIDTFLRNKVSISVVSNNTAGFTASMTTKTTDTSLANTAKNTISLPTLSANTTRSNFPVNYWGYSLDDTDAGNNSSTYRALVGSNSTPITLLSSTSATSGSKDFYFGAKADATKAAGTYTGTVVINVVSGVIDNSNPATPTNPASPSGNEQVAEYHPAPTGNTSNGATTYTYTSGGATTTQISDGDNRAAYEGYTPPQGVTYKTSSRIATNTTLAGGLAATATFAAASGIFFFILLKKRDDDEEEENPEIQQ